MADFDVGSHVPALPTSKIFDWGLCTMLALPLHNTID
jgi:hypothetical protein